MAGDELHPLIKKEKSAGGERPAAGMSRRIVSAAAGTGCAEHGPVADISRSRNRPAPGLYIEETDE